MKQDTDRLDLIARDLFGVMSEATMCGRPRDIAQEIAAPFEFDLLPHDVRRGWLAVARRTGSLPRDDAERGWPANRACVKCAGFGTLPIAPGQSKRCQCGAAPI